MPRSRSWTDDDLRAAVARSETWTSVSKALGLKPGGGTHRVLRRHADRLALDTGHMPFTGDHPRPRRRRFSDEELRMAVADAATLAEATRRLGYQPSGGMHRYLTAQIGRLGLDTSHFVGQAWARGKRFEGRAARSLDELLVKGSSVSGSRLLQRLIRAGIKPSVCEHCAQDTWLDSPIPLELDHINGDHTDNRLSNLRALCPNCHALTSTYCGRNRGRVVELADTAALGAVASA